MLLESIGDLEERGVGFRSLTESIDTSTPVGALLLTVLGAVAQMELSNIRERSAAGVQAARNRGVRIGRPPKVTLTKIEAAKEMRAAGMSTADIGEAIGLSRRSVYRALAAGGVPVEAGGASWGVTAPEGRPKEVLSAPTSMT